MKKGTVRLIFIIMFILGIVILLYPSISQYYNSFVQSSAVSNYDKIFANMKDKDYSKDFKDADSYNQKLLKLKYPLAQYKKISGYKDLLNVNNNGMIGYISINKIKVEIPIYHGTGASVLNVAVGHLEGSSLPVGGKSTHSVLSAHRGLPSAKLFTDLNKIEVGDIFEITVLDRKLTYQVDKISVVEPNDVTNLKIKKNEDYVTLMTCTPYGLNTHRLLVRGVRIENIENKKIYVTTEAFKINSLIVAPIVASPIILVLLLIVAFKPVNNQPKKKIIDEYLNINKKFGGKNNA